MMAHTARPADAESKRSVVLVGFQRQGNLGLGYLASTLRQAGFPVEIVDIEEPPEVVLEAVKRTDPVLVGFSLIFQFYIRRYGALIEMLRDEGVDCHFTMGGHYPSLSYEQTLNTVPELDSVVRYEGELTLLEMVEALCAGRDWRAIQGVVWRRGDEIVANQARPLVPDLDALPYPERDYEPTLLLGRKSMPLLASRGCARTCSFCSIHTFYRTAPGKVVRIRKPVEVVREMRMLLEERGVTVFSFQDDDFPLFGRKWRAWAGELVDELHASGLSKRVIWKINCRADAVDADIMIRMRDAGLYLVYMGLESGTEEGLRTLNKEISVEQNLAAVRLFKDLGMRFAYGFMLLDPSSSFESVFANLGFLREIVGDGSAAATFCKMLPYDGTPIKDALEASGRLKGDVCAPDYDFLDPRLDEFYADLAQLVDVTGWVYGPRALNMHLDFAQTEVAVVRQLFPSLPGTNAYEARLRRLTAHSNEVVLSAVEQLARVHHTRRGERPDADALRAECDRTVERLLEARNAFVARHEDVLLEALQIAA